jgi:hypothetical protein
MSKKQYDQQTKTERAVHFRDPDPAYHLQVRAACSASDRVEGWRDDLPLVTRNRSDVTCRNCKKTAAFKEE